MEWMAAVGEIYHRDCTGKGARWTSVDAPSGKCHGCGAPIPEEIVKLARRAEQQKPGTPS